MLRNLFKIRMLNKMILGLECSCQIYKSKLSKILLHKRSPRQMRLIYSKVNRLRLAPPIRSLLFMRN